MSMAIVALGLTLAVTNPPSQNPFDDPERVLQMALTDPDRDRRLLAASLLRSQPHLVRLMGSPEPEIRRLAVTFLTDAAALAGAALHDPDVEVRRRAVFRVSDSAALQKAALGDADAKVGEAAVGRIHDVAALDAIASGARVAATRRRAAERASTLRATAERKQMYAARAADRARLEALAEPVARAAFVMGLPAARRDAVMVSVSDRATLEEIAKRTTDRELSRSARTAAMFAIRDPDELVAAILAARPGEDRSRAVERLTSDAHLAQVALRGDAALGAQAAARIKTHAVAARVFEEAKEGAARAAVLWAIDPERLSIIAASDRHPSVRQAARARSPVDRSVWLAQCRSPDAPVPPPPAADEREEDLLALARSGAPAPERIAVIGRLTDQAALYELATRDPDRDVRAAAAATVTHTEALKMILAGEADDIVRAAAVKRLTDPATVASLARADPSPRVRHAALCNARDRTLLAERARDEPEPAVRALARGLLDAYGRLR